MSTNDKNQGLYLKVAHLALLTYHFMNIMRMSISVLSISMARYTAGSRATLLKVTSFLKRVVGFIVQSVMLDRSRAAVNTTFWLLFFASLLFSPSGTMASPLQQDLGKFIWFSDLHVDPFYGTSLAYGGDQCRQDGDMHQYGNFGCDAPWHLIQETLTQAKVCVTFHKYTHTYICMLLFWLM